MTNDKAVDLFKAMAKEAGMTDEQVMLALTKPQWKEIENRDNRHSEYASALDRAKNLEPLATKAKEWDEWWTKKGGSRLYETQQQQAERLARYQERFGELDPNNSSASDIRQAATASGMTMEQVKAMLDEQGRQFSAMNSDAMSVLVDAQNRGIKLSAEDVSAMQGMMASKGMTYGQAYSEHVGPRVREMEEKRLSKEKEDYAAEKVRDALSRVGHNGIPSNSDTVPNFFDRPKTGVAEKSMSDQELMSLWNDSAPGAKGRAA